MFNQDDFISISALSHFIYCKRRCALIHVEQIWTENLFTAQGRLMHEQAHESGIEVRGDIRINRALAIYSSRLGLSGIADVVEFHRRQDGTWLPFPVEYKLGKPKVDDSDTVQLCAQAICLEEMLNLSIPSGALFYGKTRRRLDIAFDSRLRNKTEEASAEVHSLIKSGKTPEPVYVKKCENCSLVSQCLPKTMGKRQPVKRYLLRMLEKNNDDEKTFANKSGNLP